MNDITRNMKAEMLDVVENSILSFWLDNMQDEEHGGFYGRMRGDGTLVKDASKGCILNARILWSFSAAYRVLQKPEYLKAAQRAKNYILKHFVDPVYGGTYWELDHHGNPIDTKKQFYAIGFTLYGLSEYVRAAYVDPQVAADDVQEALDMCFNLYDTIEEHSLDEVYNGYIEAQTRQWGDIADMRLSELDANYPKSQNTHLHIIEPYTNLFRCLKELEEKGYDIDISCKSKVEISLRNLIHIFTDRILNPQTSHLDLFFEMDWLRGAGWLESYGHDIDRKVLIFQKP